MTIIAIEALSAGNALKLYLAPPGAGGYLRVLRRAGQSVVSVADPAAVIVADECLETVVLDRTSLVNGVSYFYQSYINDGAGNWTVGTALTGIPAATYAGDTIDPQSLVRERVELGLAVEVQRGTLLPTSGRVPVFLAPYVLADGSTFPSVSVHLEDDSAAERFLGGEFAPDLHDPAGGWIENEGWLAQVTLNVVGVSLNPDERIALRRAIKRIVQANMGVFASSGMQQIEFRQRDVEDFQGQNAPLFMTHGTLTCLAPSYVTADLPQITDVTAAAIVPPENAANAYT